jgi:hypothetical protein
MKRAFDPQQEPMRALRDLITACECIFGDDWGEQELLDRAREGFTALRARFGDNRPADQIADTEAMIEPPLMEATS